MEGKQKYHTCVTLLMRPSIIQAVLKMLSEIGSVDNIPEFIEGVKARLLLPFIHPDLMFFLSVNGLMA